MVAFLEWYAAVLWVLSIGLFLLALGRSKTKRAFRMDLNSARVIRAIADKLAKELRVREKKHV